MESNKSFQVFLQSSDLSIPSRCLSVNPNSTLRQLKLLILPPNLPSNIADSVYFSVCGKSLRDSTQLQRILPFSNLILRIRVLGGGGDGGATGAESRDCYLNMYASKKPDKVDPNETRLSRWTTCALSFEPLSPPCVIDRLGNVFNKMPLVEALLKKKLPKEFGYIKGLKDMIPIELSLIPGLSYDDETTFETRFQCPITGLEFNGKYSFFALRGCGHVLSAKALKEVKSSTCLVCHRGFSESDKIAINGSPEEVAELREKMEEERVKARGKKDKKIKNGDIDCFEISSIDTGLSGTKHFVDDKAEVLLPSTESETNAKVMISVENIKSKNAKAKRFKATDNIPANATKEVYASIFTSSKKSNFKETYSCRSLPLGRN